MIKRIGIALAALILLGLAIFVRSARAGDITPAPRARRADSVRIVDNGPGVHDTYVGGDQLLRSDAPDTFKHLAGDSIKVPVVRGTGDSTARLFLTDTLAYLLLKRWDNPSGGITRIDLEVITIPTEDYGKLRLSPSQSYLLSCDGGDESGIVIGAAYGGTILSGNTIVLKDAPTSSTDTMMIGLPDGFVKVIKKLSVGSDTGRACVLEDTIRGIVLKNGATCYDDMRIDGLAMRLGGTPPSLAAGTRTGGIYLYWYSGTADNFSYMSTQLPHTYKPKTALHPHFHIYAEEGITGAQDTIAFGVEYAWLSIGDTSLTPNETDTIVMYKHITADSLRRHLMLESDADSIKATSGFSATDKKESSILAYRIFRPASTDAKDTYTESCALLSFDLHYQVEKMGTKNELPD